MFFNPIIFLLSAVALSVAQFHGEPKQFHGEPLKFKLAAINLPNCDLDSPSDPYVSLYTTVVQRPRHHDWHKFGQSSVKSDTLNPVWDDVFLFNYINGTNQKWRFVVYDLDDNWYNPFDDPLGRVDVNVDDYILEVRRSKQNISGSGGPLKPIQMFLNQPIGGAIYVTPISE